MKKVDYIWISIFITIIVFFSVIWSLNLPINNWPTDFGHHFYIASVNDGKGLYREFFTHKGPILVLFLDFFQIFFGKEWKSSIIILIALSIFFLGVITYIAQKISKNYFVSFLILLYIVFFYRYQLSDIFVDLILIPLVFLGNFYLFRFIDENKEKYILLSYTFIFLACLGRVDNLIYLCFLIFFQIFYSLKKKVNFFNLLLFIKIFLLLTFIYITFSFFYSFTFFEFINQNILFNMVYSEHDYIKFSSLANLYAFMPYKHFLYVLLIKIFFYFSNRKNLENYIFYSLLALSTIQIIFFSFKINFLVLFLIIFSIEVLIIFFLIIKKSNFQNYKLFICLSLNFLSFFIFLYAGSTKLNHSFMLLTGSTFLIIFLLDYLFRSQNKFNHIIKFLIIFLFIYQGEKMYRSNFIPVIENKNISFNYGINNLFYNSELINSNEIINLLKRDNPGVICDEGWLRIFSKTKSHSTMFDWWYYDVRKNLNSNTNDRYITNILTKTYGDYFLIDKVCTQNKIFSKNHKIKKLIFRSNLLKELEILGRYYQYRVIN